jgi:hypothetical protein
MHGRRLGIRERRIMQFEIHENIREIIFRASGEILPPIRKISKINSMC